MKQAKSGLYEVYLMLSPTLSEPAREASLKRVYGSIEQLGGSIKKHHDLGHRKLTYTIKKQREAYCYLVYFELPGLQLIELDREYKLNEDLIRFMIVKAEAIMDKIEFRTLESSTSER